MRGLLGRVRAALPESLTARLVATAVALVAVVCVLICTATTLAMRGTLLSRLDDDVQQLSAAALHNPSLSDPDTRNRGPGTLVYLFVGQQWGGYVLGSSYGQQRTVAGAGRSELADVADDVQPHTVHLPGFGDYRVVSRPITYDGAPGRLVTGLPMSDMNDTLARLIVWEVGLTAVGVLLAAGGGLVLVRRQLQPLRDVAATANEVAHAPLASGEVGALPRVPGELAVAGTEVGQVGSALNTLLDHVESSLDARHRSEQQVRQFVADASHELRTPLTTIRGYTELAQSRPADAAAASLALAKVEEESRRMTALVEDLLLLARLDQGRPLEQAPVDLTQLLVEAVSDARVVDVSRSWQLQLAAGADPDRPVVVQGDAQRLHQVVANLLSNARAYTPEGTTVTVSVLPDGFAVHDDGPGFPPELVPVAFERFTRGDAGRQRGRNDSGAGLGLSLVKAIVESHGGSVSLASVPGDTTITVRLPR